jgi:GntR family transcriptional regulator/MocR family aminotransferase
VAAAYDQLVAEGYLSARTGSGTIVADAPASPPRPAVRVAEPARPRFDMRPGSPDVSTFPTGAWIRSTRRALARAPASTYDYGDPRGHVVLRTALAEYLGRTRGVVATADHIVVTAGYIQALALLATAVAPGTMAMENPGLPHHRDVVRRWGATVQALPVDRTGARTDLLTTMDVRAVVLTAAHQYPTGVTLHPLRRQAVLAWAEVHNGLVIEDDYDGEFRYDRQPVGALQGLAPDRVAYVGTASKTLGPALRLGWLVLPERLIEPVASAKQHTDAHTETIGQLALADLITTHTYDRHIRGCRARYRRRRDQLVERLEPLARRGFDLHGIAAGLHVMVGLPSDGPDEEQVIARAAARGLALTGLAEHWHAPDEHPKGIIVGYATPNEGSFPAALDTLARTLRAS